MKLSLYREFRDKNTGISASVDMLRVNFRLSKNTIEDFLKTLDTLPGDDELTYYSSRRVAGYYHMYRYKSEQNSSAYVVGLGWNAPNGKVKLENGFVEYNPNKVGLCKGLDKILLALRTFDSKCELKRFDLAIDIPQARQYFVIQKDRRDYRTYQSDSITEYLGKESHEGFVKLYDKTAESGLDYNLTRLELTCPGDADMVWIDEHWPKILKLPLNVEIAGLTPTKKALVVMLSELAFLQHEISRYLAMLNNRTRYYIQDILDNGNVVELPVEQILQLLDWLKNDYWVENFKSVFQIKHDKDIEDPNEDKLMELVDKEFYGKQRKNN